MMLNEKQTNDLEKLKILRKEVELLESHKIQFQDGEELVHISQKQYEDSGRRIEQKVAELEKENGIYEEPSTINRMLKEIDRTLSEIEIMLCEWEKGLDEELYNLKIQYELDNILEVANGHD